MQNAQFDKYSSIYISSRRRLAAAFCRRTMGKARKQLTNEELATEFRCHGGYHSVILNPHVHNQGELKPKYQSDLLHLASSSRIYRRNRFIYTTAGPRDVSTVILLFLFNWTTDIGNAAIKQQTTVGLSVRLRRNMKFRMFRLRRDRNI